MAQLLEHKLYLNLLRSFPGIQNNLENCKQVVHEKYCSCGRTCQFFALYNIFYRSYLETPPIDENTYTNNFLCVKEYQSVSEEKRKKILDVMLFINLLRITPMREHI